MTLSINKIYAIRNNIQNHYGTPVSFEGRKKKEAPSSSPKKQPPAKMDTTTGSSKQHMTTAERIYREQKRKAEIIEAVIRNAIEKGETLTINDIAQKTGMQLSEVNSVIYRRTPLLPEGLFGQVKSTANMPKPPTEKEIRLAQALSETASRYMTTSEYTIAPDADYVQSLAKLLKKASLSDEVVNVIAENFPKAPAFTDTLLSLKIKDGRMRCQTIVPQRLIDLYEAYEINPDLTEELLVQQDSNGNYCFSLVQIPKIVVLNEYSPKLSEIAREAPSTVYSMYRRTIPGIKERKTTSKNPDEKSNAIEKEGFQENESGTGLVNETPIYSPDGLIGLYAWLKKSPKLTKQLLNDVSTTDDGMIYPRFSANEICYILEQSGNYPDLVNKLVNDRDSFQHSLYRFNADNICTILQQNNKKTSQLISYMVNAKSDEYDRILYTDNSYGIYHANYKKTENYRFSANDICQILKYNEKFPNLVKGLLSKTTKTFDGKIVYKYDGQHIVRLLEMASNESAEKE